MENFFGGKDPFDHPFFTQPFGGLFGGKSLFDDPFFTRPYAEYPGCRKQITIEEVNPDGEVVEGNNVWQKNDPGKELFVKSHNDYSAGNQSFSFQRVSYGGPDGWYYTSSMGRRSGGDGVVLMEMKEEDKMVGESLHTVSKGIHDKGHSFTTKKGSDGRVDSLQTLHNLNEDELSGFEENWKSNADKVLPGWNSGFNLLENAGVENEKWDPFANWRNWGGWPLPSLEYFENGVVGENSGVQGTRSGGKSRKIVPVE